MAVTPQSSASIDNTSEDQHPVVLKFPDFVSPVPYPLRCHQQEYEVSRESEQWLLSMANFDEKQTKKFLSLNAGLLSGMCYIDCTFDELRVCTDFMNFLFTLDDWTDEFDTTGTRGLGECILNTLYHLDTYQSDTAAYRLTKS